MDGAAALSTLLVSWVFLIKSPIDRGVVELDFAPPRPELDQ
jgi:hypothetical protein